MRIQSISPRAIMAVTLVLVLALLAAALRQLAGDDGVTVASGVPVDTAGEAVEPTTAGPSDEAPAAAQPSAPASPTAASPLVLAVDDEVRPTRASIASLPGEQPRPVGRIEDADGVPMDLILGEVAVAYRDPAALAAFVAAVDGTVVDRFDDEGATVRDALVRFATTGADGGDVAARMVALEPDLGGDWAISDAGVLDVFAAVAVAHDLGLVAMPNTLHEATGILQGTTTDGNGPYGTDAFTYPYVTSGGAQDIGLDRAWRLLEDTDNMDRVVRIMVHDRGFMLNADSPDARWIEDGSWGDPAPASYGATWHGALVVNAAMGKVDNGFGGAGPAGPTYAQVVAVDDAGSSWSTIRRLVDLVDEYRPHVLNMSWSGTKTTTRLAHQDFFERKFGTIRDMGTLAFASAGNDDRDIDLKACGGCIEKRLVFPCEAENVVCVGGMGEDTTARAVGGCSASAPGSNWGTRTGGRSVEIWGPYFMSAQRTTSGSPGRVCGTSFASPFVAGVAGLVHAADPDLSPGQIWEIMKQTANDGGIGGEVTGHQRRVDAAAAVERALGGIHLPPQLAITSPSHGDEYTLGDFIEFDATATDHAGRSLKVTWASDRDGVLGSSKLGLGSDDLSEGVHFITATVTDNLGDTAKQMLMITVVDQPTRVKIYAPTGGEDTWFGQAIHLAGSAEDDDLLGYSVPSEDLHWVVVRPTAPQQPLFSATGATAEVPENVLGPGTYVARLSTTVDGHTTTAQVAFDVKVSPAGAIPNAVIDEPADQQQVGFSSGNGKVIHFAGHASDAEDGVLSGTRMRWTASHTDDEGHVTELVLCTGSSVPSTTPDQDDEPKQIGGFKAADPGPQDSSPTFQAVVDCASFDHELGLDGEIGAADWTITLEAFDSSGGPPGIDKVTIGVHHAVG